MPSFLPKPYLNFPAYWELSPHKDRVGDANTTFQETILIKDKKDIEGEISITRMKKGKISIY
jgi:hypothetical protein